MLPKLLLQKKLLNKKLKPGKVIRKLLVVLKEVVVKANAEANLLKDVVCKALSEADLWEDVGDQDVVNKLCLKAMSLQAVLLGVLSQALSAKLKLCKFEAVKVEAEYCKGGLEALFCKAMLGKAPP